MYTRSVSLICFDDTVAGGQGSDTNAGGAGGDPAAGAGTPPKTFTQDQMNKILADDRRKNQAKQKELLTQLEQLQQTARLTDDERNNLNAQVEELRLQTTTAEERARTALDKQKKDYDVKVTTLTTERDEWRNRYTETAIGHEITNAAVTQEAFSPGQIAAMLRPNTRLTEELDGTGKPTGRLIPKVKFEASDKDGQPIVLDLTVPEAVKRMKETPDVFGNLFKSTAQGGLGTQAPTGQGKGGKVDVSKLTPAQYREMRAKNPAALGLK